MGSMAAWPCRLLLVGLLACAPASPEGDALNREPLNLDWLHTDGGPCLVLPLSLLGHWEGSEDPSDGRVVVATFRYRGPDTPATDYDRACDVDEPLGVLPVGPGRGLVLGNPDEISAAWFANRRHGGATLVRWEWAEDDASAERALDDWLDGRIEAAPIPGQPRPVVRGGEPCLVFGAAYTREDYERDPGDFRAQEFPPGDYEVVTLLLEPDENTRLILYDFVPKGSSE